LESGSKGFFKGFLVSFSSSEEEEEESLELERLSLELEEEWLESVPMEFGWVLLRAIRAF